MIIGKSLTALGGGGLKPEIRVTAKAGAFLNLHYKDSSIILQTYQLGAEETQHTFVVDVSETAYVVEDVTNSASVEVLVDAVAVFDVEMFYGTYLFNNGDQYNSLTGGWNTGTTGGGMSASVGITLYSESKGRYRSYEYAAYVYTSSAIDWSKYSKLNVLIASGTKSNNPVAYLRAGFSSFSSNAWPTTQKDVNISSYLSAGTTNFTVTMDISDIDTTTQFVLLAHSNSPSGYGEVFLGAHFSEVWLE